jgi:hypothetical protein
VRVGIHTGLVVVGEMGGGSRQEQLALGETPNVAARLQGLAAPDTVAISAATFRLVRGYFTYQELGSHSLKGVMVPVQVYRILEESAAQSRLDVAGTSGLTPLMGRESEVTLLLERWAHSQDGRGQVILLRGEAGIGKSRLVETLRQRVRSEDTMQMVFRCSPCTPDPEVGCGSSRASGQKRTSSWRRFTAGSPRALTPPTSRRRKRCWRRWRKSIS